MRSGLQLILLQLAILVIALIGDIVAPPNPVLDNNSDNSVDDDNMDPYIYKFDFDMPYWHAFPKRTRDLLRKHDHMEINVLRRVRDLDFKLREAWTRHDKPFIERAKK